MRPRDELPNRTLTRITCKWLLILMFLCLAFLIATRAEAALNDYLIGYWSFDNSETHWMVETTHS